MVEIRRPACPQAVPVSLIQGPIATQAYSHSLFPDFLIAAEAPHFFGGGGVGEVVAVKQDLGNPRPLSSNSLGHFESPSSHAHVRILVILGGTCGSGRHGRIGFPGWEAHPHRGRRRERAHRPRPAAARLRVFRHLRRGRGGGAGSPGRVHAGPGPAGPLYAGDRRVRSAGAHPRRARTADIPVVMLSAMSDAAMRDRRSTAGRTTSSRRSGSTTRPCRTGSWRTWAPRFAGPVNPRRSPPRAIGRSPPPTGGAVRCRTS